MLPGFGALRAELSPADCTSGSRWAGRAGWPGPWYDGVGRLSESVMAFTVQDFHDLVRLLGQHPEWRLELRRLVLAEELLELPRLVQELGEQTRQLAEAQRRTEARLEALAARVEALASRVEALAEAQQRTEGHVQTLAATVEAVAQAQRETERRLAALAESTDRRFRELQADLKDLKVDVAEVKGQNLERLYRDRAAGYFGRVLRGLKVLADPELDRLLEGALAQEAITWEERDDLMEADVVAEGRLRSTGQQAYLVVEVSWSVERDDVVRAHRRAGILGRVAGLTLAAVAGKSITAEARELAERLSVLQVTDGAVAGSAATP